MKKISIIIPAYNEEKTLAQIVKKVEKASVLSLEKEIIIINNASIDSTLEIANGLAKNNPDIKVFSTILNKGKGQAVKLGFEKATGDILIIQDADLEYDPADYEAVIEPILHNLTTVTNGVRIESRIRESNRISIGILGWIGNTTITLVTNLLYFHNAKEYEGCYKAFTKKLIDSIPIKADDFDYDNELMCKILKRGIKPIDVPIHYYPRSYTEGKKINWRHGFKILGTIIKTRFVD